MNRENACRPGCVYWPGHAGKCLTREAAHTALLALPSARDIMEAQSRLPMSVVPNDRAVHFIDKLSSEDRKEYPMATGALDYFPDAWAMVSRVSKIGNDKHNPGQPLHWAREKSMDQPDTILRHMSTRDEYEEITLPDGRVVRITHKAMVAWRAMAQLQEWCEEQYAAAKAAGLPFRPGLPEPAGQTAQAAVESSASGPPGACWTTPGVGSP